MTPRALATSRPCPTLQNRPPDRSRFQFPDVASPGILRQERQVCCGGQLRWGTKAEGGTTRKVSANRRNVRGVLTQRG